MRLSCGLAVGLMATEGSEIQVGSESMSKKKLLLYAAAIGGGIGLVVFLMKGRGGGGAPAETDMLSVNAAIALGSLQYQLLQFQGAQSIWNQEEKGRQDLEQNTLKIINQNMESGFHVFDTELDLIAGQIGYQGEWSALTPAQQTTVLAEWYRQIDAFRHEYDAGGGSGLSYTPVQGAVGSTVQSP